MRKPIFGFLWPAGDPGPLDEHAVQTRWIRICGRGPWRGAALIVLTAVVVTVVSGAIAVALTQPSWSTLTLSIIITAPLIALLARAWVAGTYVNDRGIKVSRVMRTETVPWRAVRDVITGPGSRWLATPVQVPGRRVVVHFLHDGAPETLHTDIESASPDLWLRPQAFDAAADRLHTWLRETRDAPDE